MKIKIGYEVEVNACVVFKIYDPERRHQEYVINISGTNLYGKIEDFDIVSYLKKITNNDVFKDKSKYKNLFINSNGLLPVRPYGHYIDRMEFIVAFDYA